MGIVVNELRSKRLRGEGGGGNVRIKIYSSVRNITHNRLILWTNHPRLDKLNLKNTPGLR